MSIWQELLEQVQVLGSKSLKTVSELEIASFEASHQVVLSKDYRNLCKVFGAGAFGACLTIYCLPDDQSNVEYLKRELEENRDREGTELSYKLQNGGSLNINLIAQILDFAFVFGHTSGGELLIWDLQSYSPIDDSYDIYMTRVEDFPGVYRVGRNLIEFIQKFGLGIGDFSDLPDWTWPDSKELRKTFTPSR